MNDDTDVLTLEEVARMLKMRPSSVYRLTAARAIPHVKIKRRVWFSRRAVLAWWDTKNVPMRESDVSEGQESRPSAPENAFRGSRAQELPPVGLESRSHNGAGKTSSSILRSDP